MTPDGSAYPYGPDAVAILPAPHVILLHGGRALVLFEGAEVQPPRQGQMIDGPATLDWNAECWRLEGGKTERWCGLALVDALPTPDAELRSKGDSRRWRFAKPPRVDIAPQPLADLVRKGGVDQRAVFDFLVRQLIAGRPSECAEAQAHLAFARGFFTAAAERDGFIEILAEPECGGLFAQGWSQSLPAGRTQVASVAGELAVHQVDVAHFSRDDILPPGRGFCVFAKDLQPRGAAVDALFFEKDGRLLRLDVVPSSVIRFQGAAATGHVAHMLPRLRTPEDALPRFQRICRPRFAGEDSLSATQLPIAMGLDAALHAPGGGLLLMGWMLDPLRKVRLALVKSDANLYAPLHVNWVRLPRPDLRAPFAGDPRFVGSLELGGVMHGFLVHVPVAREQVEGAQLHVELVLGDESCLFRPFAAAPFASAERLPQVLAGLSADEPELGRIVADHLAPFLAAIAPASSASSRNEARPIQLGDPGPAREVSAVMPVRSLAELQPVLALLAGTPDASALDLILIASRQAAASMLKPLGEAFRFYGLRGVLVVVADDAASAARFDAGVAASTGRRVLIWTPSALPKQAGWLAHLILEADSLPAPGLLSPALTYEDGTVCFGGAGAEASAAGAFCATAGYAADKLPRGAPTPLSAGAAEIALIDRAVLARAGGFAGRLFGDAYARIDLGRRLRAKGAGAWCSGCVDFWMLEEPEVDETQFTRLMRKVDAELLARFGAAPKGDEAR